MASYLRERTLVTNPVLLCDSAGLALAKEHDPRGQQPAGYERAQENKNRFPNHYDNRAIGNGTAHDGVEDKNQREIKRGDEAKPGQAAKIDLDQLTVRPKSFAQSLIVQNEGDLDRRKRQNKRAHENALKREIVKHIGHIDEIREQHGQSQNQDADQNNDPGPFQNITESAHGKSEESALAKVQSFDPAQTDCDQVNLNINASEVLEDKGKSIDGGGNFQEVRGRDFVIPTRQPPIDEWLEECRQGTNEKYEIDWNAPPPVKFG